MLSGCRCSSSYSSGTGVIQGHHAFTTVNCYGSPKRATKASDGRRAWNCTTPDQLRTPVADDGGLADPLAETFARGRLRSASRSGGGHGETRAGRPLELRARSADPDLPLDTDLSVRAAQISAHCRAVASNPSSLSGAPFNGA